MGLTVRGAPGSFGGRSCVFLVTSVSWTWAFIPRPDLKPHRLSLFVVFFVITCISYLSPWQFPVGGVNIKTKNKLNKEAGCGIKEAAQDGLEEERRRKEEAVTAAPKGRTRVEDDDCDSMWQL